MIVFELLDVESGDLIKDTIGYYYKGRLYYRKNEKCSKDIKKLLFLGATVGKKHEYSIQYRVCGDLKSQIKQMLNIS